MRRRDRHAPLDQRSPVLGSGVGLPDDKYGEFVGAFIGPVAGASIDEADLFAYVRERLAPHKTPKHWIAVDEFPLTGSGKIQKYVLRQDWERQER